MIADEKDKEGLRVAGSHLGVILQTLAKMVKPGVSVLTLNEKAEEMIYDYGDIPVLLNYKPQGAPRAFPATLCVAVNDTVVHGIPTEKNIVLQEGDIIGLDTAISHNGYIVDSAVTVPVGKVSKDATKLMRVTREALYVGIAAANVGNTVGDIGHAIEQYVKPCGYGIVRELCGHGVGEKIHEEPSIPNYGKKGDCAVLKEGMVIAIEPMLNEGNEKVIFENDGFTVRTADGTRSAHFEHTLVVTKDGPEIFTEV